MGGPSINRAESSGDIWTPWQFIHAVERKFGPIALDLAASGSQSAKAARWITPEEDSLKQDWTVMLAGGLGWDNCPYGNIAPWAKYHVQHWKRGARTLLLVPASVGSNWFEFHVWPFADTYSVGRMIFDNCFDRKTGALVTTVYAKDLILAHYDQGLKTGKRLLFWKDWKMSSNAAPVAQGASEGD